MPQRALTEEEIEQLKDTPFGRMKRILEERRVPERVLRAYPASQHRDLYFRITVQRCEFDRGEPYLHIAEATNSVGFVFTLDGELSHIVNYK